MGSFRKFAVFLLLVICSTQALPLEENSTDTQIRNEEIAKRRAYEAFLLISPYPRNGCLDSFEAGNNFKANELMDMALEYLRNVIREKNLDRVEIPKFEEGFSKKVGFIKVKGSFEGKDGWVESTLSIARKGDATVRLNGTSVMLDSTLGLNVLQLGMKYNAKLAHFIRVKGKLDAKVKSNALSFSGGLDYSSGNCRVFLRDLKLQELGKIEIHVTGLGKLNWLYSKIVTWVTSRLHNKIKDTVENKIKEILEKELGKIKCPTPL